MGFSLAQINRLKRDDLLKAANIPANGPIASLLSKRGSPKASDSTSLIEDSLKKIARAGDDFVSMKDYAKALIKRFDNNNDGVITFQELCDGLKTFDIDLPLKDRLGLMRKLDVDKDGEITHVELARALSTVEIQLTNEAVETCLKKVAAGAENFSNMREYVKELVRRFDENSDGMLTMKELSEGLRKMNIFLT